MKLKNLGVQNIVDPNNYEIYDPNIDIKSCNPITYFGSASFHYLKKD